MDRGDILLKAPKINILSLLSFYIVCPSGPCPKRNPQFKSSSLFRGESRNLSDSFNNNCDSLVNLHPQSTLCLVISILFLQDPNSQ